MTLRPSYLAGVLAIGLALTACSSSGGGTATPPPVTPTTAATTSAPPAVTSAPPVVTSSSAPAGGTGPSQDVLTAIVVQQSDVPADYTSAAPDTSSDDAANQQKVVQCVGSTAVDPADRIQEVHGNDFAKDPQTVSSDATSYKSQAAVDALVAVLQNPKAQACFDAFEREQVAAQGGSVTSSKVTITPGNNGGPSNVVALLRGTVDLTIQGQQATVKVVEGFIEGRQLLATVSVVALNADVDTDLFQAAGAAVANRAAAA